ncbi:MAG: Gmad2 immunoglobulin-like domain-containing protein [bacterium]|nr:Gmad2 immunoglobulin-like domain-containing protein [bacterium]
MSKSAQIIIGIVALILFISAIIIFGGCSSCGSQGTKDVSSTMVRVTVPEPDTVVRSPLIVTGEARGNWYFEASFPVKILDANGKQLGVGIAQAQGEWMTTNFVPFSATVNFSAPTTQTGTIVFQKDNPSGLPEHDAQVMIPIRFSQVVSQTRDIKLYFYDNQRDRDESGNLLCSTKGLVPVNRSIPFTVTPIQDTVKELLKGPDSVERLTTPGTEFPLVGLTLTSASLSNGVLILTFNDPENKTGGGACRVNILRAQIEATAKQFNVVKEVRFVPDGLFQP